MTVLRAYEEFLEKTPVLRRAVDELDDEALLAFVCSHGPTPVIDGCNLNWFLFEEVGWPEGAGYTADAMTRGCRAWALEMLRENSPNVIQPRLELRRKHWKNPSKEAFLQARKALEESLRAFTASIRDEG
jgi:hypothetical protein